MGSHLVDRMLAEGSEVVAIDDLSRGAFASLSHLKREKRFVFMEHDVAKPYRANVDAVFHLAVPSTRMACALDPVQSALTCVAGTLHALEVAAANSARLVIATATERWGEGVRCAETMAVDFARSRGTDVRIVRLPSSYGPRMALDGDHLVADLVRQALRGEDLLPCMRLERRVRLGYVDDVVDTLARAMSSEQHVPAIVAPSSEASVLEIAHMIAEAAGLAGVDVREDHDMPVSGPMSARPTLVDALPTSIASIAVGQEATVDLADGLARTVAWFESRVIRRPSDRPSGVYACDSASSLPSLPLLPAIRRAG